MNARRVARHVMRALAPRALVTLLAGVALSGCADTTPGVFIPPEAAAPLGDAGAEAGNAISTCRACIEDEGAPCRPIYDDCVATGRCEELHACIMSRACYLLGTTQDRIECGIPCAEDLGINALEDPEVGAVLQINACVIESCPAECQQE